MPPRGSGPGRGGPGPSDNGAGSGSRRPLLVALGVLVAVVLLGGGAALALNGDDDPNDAATGEGTDTTLEAENPTTTPVPEQTTTSLPDGPFVQIDEVVLDGGRYRVNYRVQDYTPEIGGPDTLHVHFFPDTQDPSTAGTNGTDGVDDWDVSEEASSFLTKYTPETLAGASQMCSAVATHEHAVYEPEQLTGDCADLPTG
jgi:hypothetical protein